MTLEQSTSESSDKKESRITTTRTIRTFLPKGVQEKSTPWGVTLKPVPRKSIVDDSSKLDSQIKTKTKSHIAATKAALPKPTAKLKKIQSKVTLTSTFFSIIIFD